MNRFFMMKRLLWQRVLLFVIVAMAVPLISVKVAWSQPPIITAELNRNQIALGENVNLTVTVSGSDTAPQLPVSEDYQVVGTSSAFQMSIVNGTVTQQNSYTYVLHPLRAGEIEIASIQVSVEGQSHATQPIVFQVTQSNTPAQPSAPSSQNQALPNQDANSDVFIEATVDNASPYLGQQILYIFRLYQAVNLPGRPQYEAPDFVGFWHHPELQRSQFATTISGHSYQVTELQTILFPTVVGDRTIEPARLVIPGSLFRAGATLQTEPIDLTIQPQPNPTPDAFEGATGQMGILASMETEGATVNEPLTLLITLQGTGNVEAWPDPILTDLPDGLRLFDSTTATNSQVQNGLLGGRRTYEKVIVPADAGDYLIPSVVYTYFDPTLESYQTISTAPIPLSVAAGAEEEPIPVIPQVSQSAVERLDVDIRHIKPVPASVKAASIPLTENILYWLAWGIPLLLIVADSLWQRQRQRNSDPIQVARAKAQKNANRLLSQAGKGKVHPHEAVGQAINGYLSDKLGQPMVGLTQKQLTEQLQHQGIDGTLIQRIQELLMVSEMGRYAPTVAVDGDEGQDLLADTKQLIKELERALKG